MRNKTFMKHLGTKGIAVFMAAVMLMTGCGQGSDASSEIAAESVVERTLSSEAESSQTESSQAVAEVEQKDAVVDLSAYDQYRGATVNYGGETIQVGRQETIEIDAEYDFNNSMTSVYDAFTIYEDKELTSEVYCSYEWREADKKVVITAPRYGAPATVDFDSDLDTTGLTGAYLEDSGWGNLPQLYLATYVDVTTGEKLDTPIVTVIKLDAEIKQTPNVRLSTTDDGCLKFSWDAIAGAEEYLVFKLEKSRAHEDMPSSYQDAKVFARVKGTEWVCESNMLEFEDATAWDKLYEGATLMNQRFCFYYQSEDDLLGQEISGTIDDFDYGEFDQYFDYYYGVMAVNKSGASLISNLIDGKQASHLVPYKQAFHANDQEGIKNSYQSPADLPATYFITMCDGTTVQRTIIYDFDNGFENDWGFYAIGATIEGTQFKWGVQFRMPEDMDAFNAEAAAIKERQEKMRNKGGIVETAISFDVVEKTPDVEKTPVEETPVASDETPASSEVVEVKPAVTTPLAPADNITANSRLSAFIATHMLATEESFNIGAFPEAADTQVVADAIMEAKYQNPLILGVKGATMDRDHNVYIQYDYDKATTAKKQQEVTEKVNQIIATIIKDGMTDSEKEEAINAYLCENGVYDDAALENAKEHDYKFADASFDDSFTAYGILVNGVGVCASYSASFKLLADAAGLDSVVVTGYLDGALAHAWNKVKIDGSWHIVDSTNNDNEYFPNALYNLSDKAAEKVLSEDAVYAMDDSILQYKAPSDNKEYYRANAKYFSKEDIITELADALKAGNTYVTLRTDYDLNDETFVEIAQSVVAESGVNFRGGYWFGVIYLQAAQ